MTLLGHPRAIAVLRALQLGDLLCAVPALRSLRAAHPGACITLIALPWARELAARFSHYIDDFVAFPGMPGLPEARADPGAWPEFLRTVHDRRFDVAIQMHGDGRITNALTALLGAPVTAGYCRAGGYRPDPQRYLFWRDGEHEVHRWLRLVRELGAPGRGAELEFPVTLQDREALARVLQTEPLSRFVCVHPGSQLASRRWLPERFAAVADALADDGYTVVLTGTAAEEGLVRRVAGAMRAPALDLAGLTNLGALAALVARADLVVCNDTGVSHVAAALRTPSVVVSCGSDPARWRPLDRSRHIVLHAPLECRPCAWHDCPFGHPCAHAVAARDVIDATRALLAAAGRARSHPEAA